MKKWGIVLLLMFLLTGCSAEPAIYERPPSLKVTYGENDVYAQTSQYQWSWKQSRSKSYSVSADTESLGVTRDKLPCLNATQDTALRLTFAEEPERVVIQQYSAADGYVTGQEVELVGGSLQAPLDGEDHLYTVSAVWLEGGDSWGSCTYEFRFLAKGQTVISSPIQMEVAADLDLAGLLALEPSQIWGLEFLNNYDGTTRTCRSSADKTAILSFLKSALSADMMPGVDNTESATEYMMRIVTVSGSQLTVAYAGDFLDVGGVAYEVGDLNFDVLWSSLEAGTMSQAAVASGKNYLDMSDAFPGNSWGSDSAYGYLRSLEDAVSYDEMRWQADANSPDGFTLENGWSGQSAPLAEGCQFWILENGQTPYCRVTAQELWQHTQDSESEVLYQLFFSGGEVIAICQQLLP